MLKGLTIQPAGKDYHKKAAIPNSISGFVNWRCRAVAAAIFTWSDQ
jgi:hypothetical protein